MKSPDAGTNREPNDQRFSAPSVSLPKGGGAIKGIGEKFAANPVTGTGSLTIPLPLSPGRSGFTPALALAYDSGSGNGPYGFGWSVGCPVITRRTDRGLPKYLDSEESDVFILSGAEDLVPVLRADNSRFREERNGYRIHRYRPRIEGLFARIDRWTSVDDPTDVFWRSISRDNVTTFYGKTAEARIADPENASRIFAWFVCDSHDDKGNSARYEYLAEDSRLVDTTLANESNRPELSRSAYRYLKRVKYGNTISRLQPEFPSTRWLFEVVMDYGDHEGEQPTPQPTRAWPVRPDPFSTHRAAFEVRTYRRCQRILAFHQFAELGPKPQLVRSLTLDYNDLDDAAPDAAAELSYSGSTRLGSFLRRATLTGYSDTGVRKSMPPLELSYSRPKIDDVVRTLDDGSYEHLPVGVDGAQYRWLDLNSEGLSGVLTEHGGAWWYKPNLGNGRLGAQQPIVEKPAVAISSGVQFMDLAGDGLLDVVQFESQGWGFFERTSEDRWAEFTPFRTYPNIDWDNPNLRFVDLTGDGHADLLITEDDIVAWHPAHAEDGYGPRESIRMAADDSRGPRVVFNDATDTIFLADMSGDGLSDLVRIRNGEVSYWPNLGYGRFGAKVTMDNAPVFDMPDQFDSRRLRLGDIDGSGVTDILYLASDGVRLYFNRSGNGWTGAKRLPNFPPIDNIVDVTVTDLLGNGTACLVWSSALPRDARTALFFVDLMGGEKPHLLTRLENNIGAEIVIHYTASTRFYLADRATGRAWITRLPFPVHVVDRVQTDDRVSRSRFVTRYAYHHGYFDGVEREFRGFGMVEQWDTEEFAALNEDQQILPATNVDASSHVPPVLTRTWFHTGVHLGRARVSSFFAGTLDERDTGEYYREPGLTDEQSKQLLLDDTLLPLGLSVEEEREACRALKGATLRQEVYALDGSDKQPCPYSVTEQNYTIRLVQPQGVNPHAVFFSHPRESSSCYYERSPADPRVAHALTLEVDAFGNVLKSAAAAYGRRRADLSLDVRDQHAQDTLHLTCTESRVTNFVEAPDEYRAPLPCEARTYDITGLLPVGNRFTLDEVLNGAAAAEEIAYEQIASSGVLQKRVIEHVRTIYRSNDLKVLQIGHLESQALAFESYKLAFTPGLITGIYSGRVTDTMMDAEGRYVHIDGDANWWIRSGQIFYSPDPGDTAAQELVHARNHFFVPHRYRDPFHSDSVSTEAFVSYDTHDLLIAETRDTLGNRITVGERDPSGQVVAHGHDYRVLSPRVITDQNGNRAAVSFDALGMVVGTAIMGKRDETPRRGDLLDGFVPDLDEDVVAAHLTDPLSDPHAILGRATTRVIYDLFAYHRTKQQPQPTPSVVYALTRETHDADLAAGHETRIQHSLSYSDGFGQEIQKKVQAEPGPVIEGGPMAVPRWLGSGWTILNNKGKTVRQFEPFFTPTHVYEFDVRIGVSPVFFYDAAGRLVATLHPNHTWEKVIFDAWRQETWDVNDTVLVADPAADPDVGGFFQRVGEAEYLPTWHAQRQGGAFGAEEQTAAARTAIHAGTPTLIHADALGRLVLTIAHNRFTRSDIPASDPPTEEFYSTRVVFDIEGNQRLVIDANDRVVMRYDYDIVGNQIHQIGMDAGERWSLADVAGKPIFAADSLDHRFRTAYDSLQRPTDNFFRKGAGPEQRIGRTFYGESQPLPEARNQRGKAVQLFDQAGVVTVDGYDFKGNPLGTHRQLARKYKATLDWSGDVPLEPQVYTCSSRFDAVNRPVIVTAPDDSVYRPAFNEANLLQKVDVNLRGAPAATPFVTNIEYNAKGQRLLVEYANDVTTARQYDPLTSRLSRLATKRLTDQAQLQDLTYTYDPVGNIARIQDGARQTIYFSNEVALPGNGYTYDATYRLIATEGREHVGQASQPQTTWDDRFRVHRPHPNDDQAMRPYTEECEYDAVGNFLELVHRARGGNWTRTYGYDEPSLIESGKTSNRLSQTAVGSTNPITESYAHDSHGNMTNLPHLSLMQWDFMDRLQATARQVVNNGSPETTHYVYDGNGQRVRKVTERQNGTRKSERTYLGGFEVYREYADDGSNVTLERETLHVMDDEQRVALVETRTEGHDDSPVRVTRYQFGNHLGSASLELDDQAEIISYEEYYAYGGTSYQAGRSEGAARLKRYRYTGKERDDESGFSYHGARYYAPWLGRWTSADPIGLADGVNLYRYVRDNPIGLIDPAGTDSRNMRVQFVNVDDLPQTPDSARVVVPQRAAKNLSPVTVNDLDAQRTTVTTMDAVRSSPAYVDNEIVSAGAEVSNLMYLNIVALNFRYTNKPDALIPVGAIDFQSKLFSYEFVKSNGVIYPVSSDGNVAFNELNTPTMLAYVDMKQQHRAQLLSEREEYGWMIYAFSQSIKQLGRGASSIPSARFGTGQLVTRSREIGSGSGDRQSPFNPSGSKSNCVNCTAAFLNSVQEKQLVKASANVAVNKGGISNANAQIAAQTGVRFGAGQYRTLNTGKPLQFFVVYPGASKTAASHVLIGINNGGRTMIYDPQSGAKHFDIEAFGRFTAYPVAFPSGN